jgi:hypothetical protein
VKLVVAIVIALTATAHADRAKAEQYFRAGEQAFRKQSFAAAAENFELAYQELPLPEIAFSAAQAYRRQYYVDPQPAQVKRAVELYKIYLDKVKSGGRVGDASDGLAEMLHELDRLTAKGAKLEARAGPTTRIAVSIVSDGGKTTVSEISALPVAAGDDAGATATIDGKSVELYTPVEVSAGEHVVTVASAGYAPFTTKRRVIEGQTEIVEAALQPLPAHLAIATEAGADIAIDGKPVPASSLDLPAGMHVVAITRRGREPVLRQIQLARGETRALPVVLSPTSQRRTVPWLVIGGSIVAAVAITTGAVALYEDHQAAGLETQRETIGIDTDQLGSLRHDTRLRDGFDDAMWISAGAAVVAGATAAALYYFDTPAPRETTLVPVAGAHGAGISLVGKF